MFLLDHIDAIVEQSMARRKKGVRVGFDKLINEHNVDFKVEMDGCSPTFYFTLPENKYNQLLGNLNGKASVKDGVIRYGNCIITKKD